MAVGDAHSEVSEAANALVSHLVWVKNTNSEVDWRLVRHILGDLDTRAVMLHVAVIAAAEVCASAEQLEVDAEEMWQRQLLARAR